MTQNKFPYHNFDYWYFATATVIITYINSQSPIITEPQRT
jgi:hypothetical protein